MKGMLFFILPNIKRKSRSPAILKNIAMNYRSMIDDKVIEIVSMPLIH